MPLLQVHLLEGRPTSVRTELVRELTAVVERVLGARPEQILVLVTEYVEGDWNVAGEPLELPQAARHE